MPGAYFPPLDKCLSGSERLTSWKTAYRALCDPKSVVDSSALEAFLTDAESEHFVTHSLDPYSQPSAKAKSDFEAKTAPIHAPQSSNGDCDLQELKNDASWLSGMVEVDEVSALRVVILEWQQRAEDQLRFNGSVNSTTPASGDLSVSTFGKSRSNLGVPSINGENRPPGLDFRNQEVRRERQLGIYLEEKSYILKLSVELINQMAVRTQNSNFGRTWLDQLSKRVTETQCSSADVGAHDEFCASCIYILDSAIQRLDDATKWPRAFQTDSHSKRMMYAFASFSDITTILRILLANLYMLQGVPSATAVLAWFRLMARANFFQDLQPSPALPDPMALQSLVSIVSVAMLQAPAVIEHMQAFMTPLLEGAPSYPILPSANDGYFQNNTCISELNVILYRAALDNIPLASPAIYAWAIITGFIRDIARMQMELREQRAIEDGSSDSEPISRRRASRRESTDAMSTFEKQFALLQDFDLEGEARDDPPTFLTRAAVDGMDVYGVMSQLGLSITSAYCSEVDVPTSFIGRGALFELIREAMPVVSYGGEILEALLTVLLPAVPGRSRRLDAHLSGLFLADGTLRQTVLEQALARYPFELSPLLGLFTALASAISSGPHKDRHGQIKLVQVLEDLQSMTVMVPEHFRGYALEHEDENTNSISLVQSLPIFVSKQAISYYGRDYVGRPSLTMGSGDERQDSNVFAIPTGTSAVVVKESRPMIFRLEHQHSGLEYFGLLLSTLLPNSELLAAPLESSALDRSTAAEIVSLITALLDASLRQHQGIEEARYVLGRFSQALPNEQADICSIVAEVFEVELLAHLDQSFGEGSLELLIACAEFFVKLVEIKPERGWAALSRSSLLGITGGANALAAVVAGAEVPVGRYRFLAACVRMYDQLLEDAVGGLVRRKVRVNKSTNRFDSPMSFQDVTPERTMSTVLNAYQRVMFDAWQSLLEWRFTAPAEKSEISVVIMKALEKLLRYTYGVSTDGGGISGLLFPSATAILDAFAPEAGSGTTLQPFAAVLELTVSADDESLPSQLLQAYIQQTKAALDCLIQLIRTTRMVDETGNRAKHLGTQLLATMPTLALLMAFEHSSKSQLTMLSAEIVQVIIPVGGASPSSLLGALNAENAKAFLSVISQVDRPLLNIETESSIWSFLSAVMSSKQQWFAVYLLTGRVPKDRLKDRESKDEQEATAKRSLLAYALDQLSKIAELPPERALAMLKFVASTQNAWIWATNEIRAHQDFLKNTLEWLSKLQVPARSPNIAEELMLANEHQMAAHLCDILAVNLHASLEIGDKTLLMLLVTKFTFLRDHGVDVDAYKRSLHKNLAENFARKFEGCDVADFKRTSSNSAPFGRRFFYDVDLAERVLGHEMAWHGTLNGRNQGFTDEFARANVNLSLLEAQRRLLQSWSVLSTVLCECVEEDKALQNELARTAERCLQANVDANLEVPGMDVVMSKTAEMAFVIASKLVGMKAESQTMKALMPAAWSLVKSSPVDYDVATATEDLSYYRTLLQVLYLAVQPYIYMSTPNARRGATDETRVDFLEPAISACFVQIVTSTIATGFRALCGNLHNGIELAQPGDFALLTALLQATLSVPGVAAVHPQIAEIVASTSLVRGALSLYSWSDRLANQYTDSDPIYGEVATTFLLALSTVRPVAELMAVEGVLVQLEAANLSNYFRKLGGKGPFSEPRRMFTIWTEGFMPLCLNLLDAVGPPLAAEVSRFLNSFPEQLKRAESSLENRERSRQNPHAGSITLGSVSEAHNLCVIALILASDVAMGAAEGINAADVPKLEYDYKKVKEDAAGLTRQRQSLAPRIVPIGGREEEWSNGTTGGVDSILQSKIVKEIKALMAAFGEEQ